VGPLSPRDGASADREDMEDTNTFNKQSRQLAGGNSAACGLGTSQNVICRVSGLERNNLNNGKWTCKCVGWIHLVQGGACGGLLGTL
jgi:hypothetical protein